jgi:hypothetical protein
MAGCRESQSGLPIALVASVLNHSMAVTDRLAMNLCPISPTAPVMALVVESQCGLTGLRVLCRPQDLTYPIALSDSPTTDDRPTSLNFLHVMTNSLGAQETAVLTREIPQWALT